MSAMAVEYPEPPELPELPAPMDEMTQAALRNVISRHRPGDPMQSNTFRVAAYLQSHPRRRLRCVDIGAALDLTTEQVSSVLQHFVVQRTDVTREARGEYMYTPGRGPGIKPKEDRNPAVSGVPAEAPAPARSGAHMASRPGATLWIKFHPEEAAKILAGLGPQESPPLLFTELPGMQTSDGRKVVRDDGGVLYSLVELT